MPKVVANSGTLNGRARVEGTNVAISSIIQSIARDASRHNQILVSGVSVPPDQVLAALEFAAERLESPLAVAWTHYFRMIVKWLLFSVAMTLILTILFKVIGLWSVGDSVYENLYLDLILKGDLLLISAAFAAEAIGDLFVANKGKETPRLLVGFACVVGLIGSISFIAASVALLRSQPCSPPPNPLGNYQEVKRVIVSLTPWVFCTTIVAVLVSKLIAKEAYD